MVFFVYVQFCLNGLVGYVFIDVFYIDSCVFVLEYGGYYGKINVQMFEVYQLVDIIGNFMVYYCSSSKLYVIGNLIVNGFNVYILLNFFKEVVIDGDSFFL